MPKRRVPSFEFTGGTKRKTKEGVKKATARPKKKKSYPRATKGYSY